MDKFDPDWNRFVLVRCPICNNISPVVDQRKDPQRKAMGDWWDLHKRLHMPYPIIELAFDFAERTES